MAGGGALCTRVGKGSQRFTESDVDRLKFLRRLLLEVGLPVSTVKELYARFYHGPVTPQDRKTFREKRLTELPSNPEEEFVFPDLRSKRLADYSSAFSAVRDAMVRQNERMWIDNRLTTLMAIRTSDLRGGNPTVYAATKSTLSTDCVRLLKPLALDRGIARRDKNTWISILGYLTTQI